MLEISIDDPDNEMTEAEKIQATLCMKVALERDYNKWARKNNILPEYRQSMKTDFEAFFKDLVRCPDDDTTTLAFADFIQEHGLESLAVSIRAAINLKRNRTFYAVSSGDSSDYRVRAIFSSRENAEQFIEVNTREGGYESYNDIEEYELDPGTEKIAAGFSYWSVDMQMDPQNGVLSTTVEPCTGESSEDSKTSLHTFPNGYKRFWVQVWAKDAQHAAKIANEKRVVALTEEVQKTPSKRK